MWVTKYFEKIVAKFLDADLHTMCVFNSVKVRFYTDSILLSLERVPVLIKQKMYLFI